VAAPGTEPAASVPAVALLTAQPDLAALVERMAAAAGAALRTVADPGELAAHWRAAPLVLLGPDGAAALGSASPILPRRPGVVVVSRDLDDAGIWRQALAAGAEHVALLPDGEGWLLDRLAEAAEELAGPARGRGTSGTGTCVSVLGGRGGAGATVFATALALRALRRGLRTTLVDADPLGGGIDLVFGAEGRPGLRWPDLAQARGRVPPSALGDALPDVGELSVLSWDRSELPGVPPDATAALLDTCLRSSDLVVVDLPRHLDPSARSALARSSHAIVVVPAEVRACAAAARVAAGAAWCCPRLELVVRFPGPARMRPAAVAEALGLPLVAAYRSEASVPADLERGIPPGLGARGPLARAAERVLDRTLPARTGPT
jgi:secretion/DNA translocation related CpaE-like protein